MEFDNATWLKGAEMQPGTVVVKKLQTKVPHSVPGKTNQSRKERVGRKGLWSSSHFVWNEQARTAEVCRALSTRIATPTQYTSVHESLLHVLQT